MSELENDKMEVEYISHREGLNSFVAGLLVALSERFNEPMSIEAVEDLSPDDGTHKVSFSDGALRRFYVAVGPLIGAIHRPYRD